jgi:hypothetical protein
MKEILLLWYCWESVCVDPLARSAHYCWTHSALQPSDCSVCLRLHLHEPARCRMSRVFIEVVGRARVICRSLGVSKCRSRPKTSRCSSKQPYTRYMCGNGKQISMHAFGSKRFAVFPAVRCHVESCIDRVLKCQLIHAFQHESFLVKIDRLSRFDVVPRVFHCRSFVSDF